MLKRLCLMLAASLLAFALLEGVCSSLFVARELWSVQTSTSSLQYDPELGWVSVPNFYDDDYYAPGTALRTNSRGYRASREFTEHVPSGKLRIICSGDSQSFGVGVDNDRTWCQQLESIDSRFEVVNMSESGYGVDQMYLRYRRDGMVLDHDVHVFAVVTEDFRRLEFTTVGGYGKPVLRVRDDGELVTENVPVPVPSQTMRWLSRGPHVLQKLRSFEVLAQLFGRVLPHDGQQASSGGASVQDRGSRRNAVLRAKRFIRSIAGQGRSPGWHRLVSKILEDLDAMAKRKGAILVVVFLPTRGSEASDYGPEGPSAFWRGLLRAESAKVGTVFIDMMDGFLTLPVTMREGMFIWPGSVHHFVEVPGHYNDEGHAYVARELHAKLVSMPEIGERLTDRAELGLANRSADASILGHGRR